MHRAKKVKMHEEEMGKNLKLYCTTLYHRSNGLTSQLLANGIMGKQRQEKDKDNDVRGPRQNIEQLPWQNCNFSSFKLQLAHPPLVFNPSSRNRNSNSVAVVVMQYEQYLQQDLHRTPLFFKLEVFNIFHLLHFKYH